MESNDKLYQSSLNVTISTVQYNAHGNTLLLET